MLEAARTEIDNLASLRQMMAAEAELKARAAVVKKAHAGPSLKVKSSKVGDCEQVPSPAPDGFLLRWVTRVGLFCCCCARLKKARTDR